MKTPDEVKKGLECCIVGECNSKQRTCHYRKDNDCTAAIIEDALAYIQQLERERDEALEFHKELVETNNNLFAETVEMQNEISALRKELEQVKRERDAAVRDLGMFAWGRCAICVHCDADKRYEPCLNCGCCEGDDDNWHWRGPEVE